MNMTTSQGTDPLSIRITGTGEYVKEQCAHLVDFFYLVESDQREDIRQSYENN